MYRNLRQIRVILHRAELMHYVKKEMEWVHVHACLSILGIPIQDVVRNASPTPIVIVTRPVITTVVKILALGLAA